MTSFSIDKMKIFAFQLKIPIDSCEMFFWFPVIVLEQKMS